MAGCGVLVPEMAVQIRPPQLAAPARSVRTICERMFVRAGPRYTEAEAREAVAVSRSYSDALRRLGMRPAGGNHATLRKYVEIWRIPTAHFDPWAARREALRRDPLPLGQVLVEDSTYGRRSLKLRLYEAGLKERRCELCGQGELWRGRRMSLILDHVNGVANDNRLENLRIVCPNCAATLDTHCGKNLRLVRQCARCGAPFRPKGRQRHCSRRCGRLSDAGRRAAVARRRAERPAYAQLRKEIAELGYLGTGRRYGVSDNAIRKWLRQYEREAAA
jgi:hypothetical protein